MALRLAFALGYWVDKPLTHDEREYLLIARNVAGGRGFVHHQPDGSPAPGEHFGRAPVYPVFLAGIIRATGGLPDDGPLLLPVIRVAQAVLGGALVWLVAWSAGSAAGSKAAATAAWLAAVYPPLVWTPAFVWSETLFSVLALGCAAVLSRERRTPRHVRGRRGAGRPRRADAAGHALLPAARRALARLEAGMARRRVPGRSRARSSSRRGPSGTRASTAASCSWPRKAASRSGPATTRWPSARAISRPTRN